MGLLFTSNNRERLLVGQLLSQKRPQSGRRSQWLVGEWRKERGAREEGGRAALATSASSLPPCTLLGPVVRHRLWKSSAFFSLTRHTFLPPAGTATAQTLILSFAERQGEQGPHMFTEEAVQSCSELWLARRLQSGLSPG